ncbi:hypothetical protein JMUB6875_54510 [Nocardia sp. JMUB6875]
MTSASLATPCPSIVVVQATAVRPVVTAEMARIVPMTRFTAPPRPPDLVADLQLSTLDRLLGHSCVRTRLSRVAVVRAQVLNPVGQPRLDRPYLS